VAKVIRRILVLVGFFGLVVVVIPLVIALGTMAINNLRMNDWKDNVFATSTPPGSTVVRRGTDYGLLHGQGNHCDKLAWLELRGASVSAVDEHYTRLLETDDRWVKTLPADEGLVRVEVYQAGENAGWDPRCH
jgi:hypothetical protein